MALRRPCQQRISFLSHCHLSISCRTRIRQNPFLPNPGCLSASFAYPDARKPLPGILVGRPGGVNHNVHPIHSAFASPAARPGPRSCACSTRAGGPRKPTSTGSDDSSFFITNAIRRRWVPRRSRRSSLIRPSRTTSPPVPGTRRSPCRRLHHPDRHPPPCSAARPGANPARPAVTALRSRSPVRPERRRVKRDDPNGALPRGTDVHPLASPARPAAQVSMYFLASPVPSGPGSSRTCSRPPRYSPPLSAVVLLTPPAADAWKLPLASGKTV